MPGNAPSFAIVNPSFIEPGLILPYVQASGAFETLAAGEPLVRLNDGDLYVYMKRIDVRTRVTAGQSAYNLLPSVSATLSMISSPSYLLRVRAEYDHHDTAAMGRWDVNIVELQRLGMRQGHFQLARTALLSGFQPNNGEGLLNTSGATSVTLPADSSGNSTVVTYDNGELGVWLLTQISALKTRCNQLGIGRKFVLLGPQRTMAAMEYQNIVQLTSYQREGGGTTSTAGLVQNVLQINEDEIFWCYDDTLLGSTNNDQVILIMPEVRKPVGGKINTNEIARLAPGIEACSLMYTDMAAPREIPTPLPGGAIDVLSGVAHHARLGYTSRGAYHYDYAVSVILLSYQPIQQDSGRFVPWTGSDRPPQREESMKVYIANGSQQNIDFQYRIPNVKSMRQQIIPIGGQIVLSGDLSKEAIDAIINQHSRYGLANVSDLHLFKGFYTPYIYSIDKEIPSETIAELIIQNRNFKTNQGIRIRQEAAIAINDMIETTRGEKINSLEVTIEEVATKDKSSDLNEGVRITRDRDRGAPQEPGKIQRLKAAF